ncbi:MAG: hypothetical protein JWM57_2597, partial [Phycisphaerales bacterium]|nr:hypothetical protein [Phycisphaerales bacterium]
MSEAIEALCRGEMPAFVDCCVRLNLADEQRGDAVAGLVEWFDAEDRIAGAIAAGLVLLVGSRATRTIEEAERQRATDILAGALNSDDEALLLVSCALLTNCAAPPKLVPRLERLVGHSIDYIRVYAAAALTQSTTLDSHGLSVLAAGLRHKDRLLSGIACMAMLQIGVQTKVSRTVLEQSVKALHAGGQYDVWLKIKSWGVRSDGLAELAADTLRDAALHPGIRGAAAIALATLSGDADRAAACLFAALRPAQCPWQVISGTIDGLKHLGRSHLIENRLRSFLVSDDEQTRFTAAFGLFEIGPGVAGSTDLLLSRFKTEPARRVREMVGHALSKIATDAVIDAVVGCLTVADGDRDTALGTLRYTGKPAAAAVGRLFRLTKDRRLQSQLAGVLAAWGQDAAPALADLCHVLDTTTDLDLAYTCVRA